MESVSMETAFLTWILLHDNHQMSAAAWRDASLVGQVGGIRVRGQCARTRLQSNSRFPCGHCLGAPHGVSGADSGTQCRHCLAYVGWDH